MPLRAFVNGQEKISISYSDEEWNELKAAVKGENIKIELACCRQNGFLRTSSKGLKHFIHAKDTITCDWKPESPEHLKAKIEIVEACLKNNWQAIPEYSEKDWRADVLAIKNEARIAFEIQWSPQTSEQTQERQDRYKESKVRGCWFFRTIPKGYREWGDVYVALREIPFFKLIKLGESNIVVNLNKSSTPIGEFVASLLSKEIKFCESYRGETDQEIEIVFFKTSCWKCFAKQHLYTVLNKIKSRCKAEMYLANSMWESDGLDKHPNVVKAVMQIIKANPKFKIGAIKKRFSKTVQDTYLSFGCYSCDALFGDFPLRQEKMEALNYDKGETFKVRVDLESITEEGKHWCYSRDKKFCE